MSDSVNIPDFMPELRHGTGKTPKDGGCLVQIASWIGKGRWTDQWPDSGVENMLSQIAITTNDGMSDNQRQRLTVFAARLANTSDWMERLSRDEQIDVQRRMAARSSVFCGCSMCDTGTLGAGTIAQIRKHHADLSINRLGRMIDAFDEAVGRTEADVVEPTQEVWRELADLMGTLDDKFGRFNEKCSVTESLTQAAS
jgi:hypothetical protein